MVLPGATLRFASESFNFTGSTILLHGGTLQLETYTLQAGIIFGTGTIDAPTYTNASEVSPGVADEDEIGAVTFSGAYTQIAEGKLTLDIEETGAGNFDTLNITGNASLGGTLEVNIEVNTLQAGDSFEIITAGDLLGTTFDNLVTTGTSEFFLALDYEDELVSLITFNTGNMNRSGGDEPDEEDIPAFALALTNPAKYFNDFGASSDNAGDIDGDGDCDVDDIDDFKNLLPNMSMAEFQYRMAQAMSVPEPASLQLGFILALGLRCRLWGFR
jgi:hypothetical protein